MKGPCAWYIIPVRIYQSPTHYPLMSEDQSQYQCPTNFLHSPHQSYLFQGKNA